MGPMLWWWRWWMGEDPNRDRQLMEARGLLDERRTQSDELTGQLQARDREIEELRGTATTLEQQRAEGRDARERELAAARAEVEDLRARVAELEASAADDATPPDVSEAREILGSKVAIDDLTMVEGVGPKIAGLLNEAGIDSWRALGNAQVERLRGVLTEAGPRYRMHDPSAWPTQAKLLAAGRWQDFKDLTTG